MARTMVLDTLETLHFLKQSIETLKGSYNRPAAVRLRTAKAMMIVNVEGMEIIIAEQRPYDLNQWKVSVELEDFKGRFKLTPTTPHRLVVTELDRPKAVKEVSAEQESDK